MAKQTLLFWLIQKRMGFFKGTEFRDSIWEKDFGGERNGKENGLCFGAFDCFVLWIKHFPLG
jgi:hypothetical protein